MKKSFILLFSLFFVQNILSQTTYILCGKLIDTETGNLKINGEKHFYSKRDGITSYFNSSGQQVDKNGKRITNSAIKNPVFYYNGEQISSNKANVLLSSNKNIAVTNKNLNEGKYAVILSDISTFCF